MQREPRQREKAAGARRLLDQELDTGRAKMTPDCIERESSHLDFRREPRSYPPHAVFMAERHQAREHGVGPSGGRTQ
jgi:hypothetical protein